MESQPQSPEFRINPENFRPCVIHQLYNVFWVLKRTISLILFDLILYVPSTIFLLNRDGSFWVEPVLS